MTQGTAKELWPVIKAFAEGAIIESQATYSPDCNWVSPSCPNFEDRGLRFRIKPEPRELWVNEYDNGELGYAYTSPEAARQRSASPTRRLLHFREVL